MSELIIESHNLWLCVGLNNRLHRRVFGVAVCCVEWVASVSRRSRLAYIVRCICMHFDWHNWPCDTPVGGCWYNSPYHHIRALILTCPQLLWIWCGLVVDCWITNLQPKSNKWRLDIIRLCLIGIAFAVVLLLYAINFYASISYGRRMLFTMSRFCPDVPCQHRYF